MKKFTDKQKENIKKAAKILKNAEVEELELYNFGIYFQYEMAGKKINPYLLDEYTNEKLSDEDYDTLTELLSFTASRTFIDKLGFPNEGQNTLFFNNKGNFNYKIFSL